MDFTLAVFGEAGELQSVAPVTGEGLSEKWIGACRKLLDEGGGQFDVNWSGPLAHVRTKLTAAGGAAMVSFGVGDQPAAALFLASGAEPQAEAELLQAWIGSLRSIPHVQQASRQKDPFADALTLAQRPAVVAVPWEHTGVTGEDADLVRELAMHLAVAFLDEALRPPG